MAFRVFGGLGRAESPESLLRFRSLLLVTKIIDLGNQMYRAKNNTKGNLKSRIRSQT